MYTVNNRLNTEYKKIVDIVYIVGCELGTPFTIYVRINTGSTVYIVLYTYI